MKQLPFGTIACIYLCLVWSPFVYASPVLVDIDWVRDQLQDSNIILVDMSSDELQYQRFHLPGAIHVSYEDLVMQRKDKVSVRIPDTEFYKRLGSWGIKNTDYIVVYDDVGGLNAGRMFWQLERIGHARVSVINGGLVRWILAGYPVENRVNKRTPQIYQANRQIRNNEILLEPFKQAAADRSLPILDVRTEEEYLGSPKYRRTGHVPNARWWPWDDTIQLDQGFIHQDLARLEDSLKQVGIEDRAKPVLLYCQSGHRAAQTYLTLRYLGYAEPKIYDGSMAEYSLDTTARLVIGRQP